jgi:hypothetical protein
MAQAQQAYDAGMLNAAQAALDAALALDSADESQSALQELLTARMQEQLDRALQAYALQATNLAAAVRLWDAVCAAFQDGTLAAPDQPARPLTDWRDEAREQLEAAREAGKQVQNDFAKLLSDIQQSDWDWTDAPQGYKLLEHITPVTQKLPDAADLHNLQKIIQYFHEFAEESKSFATLAMTEYDLRPDDWSEKLDQGFEKFKRSYDDSREKIEAITHDIVGETCQALLHVLEDLEGLYDAQRRIFYADEPEVLTKRPVKMVLYDRFWRKNRQGKADE